MRRNTLNFLIDLTTALVVLGITATGLIVRYVLPPGSGYGRTLWSWNRHEWGDVHFWLAVAAGGLLLGHLALHWQWVCVTTLRLCRRGQQGAPGAIRRNLAGATLLVGLIGLGAGFLWLAQANVKVSAEGGGHRGRGGATQVMPGASRFIDQPQPIRGSMSLGEVAATSGVPVDRLRTSLGLPANVSPDERLGRLRQRYGFTMQQVRETVAATPKESRNSAGQ